MILDNRANIDESILNNIVDKAEFPKDKLLLCLLPSYQILQDDDGKIYQGIFFHKSLLIYDDWITRIHSDCDYFLKEKEWDYGISISGHICIQHEQFPAFFAYVLGHELGHAKICKYDIDLHIHACLINRHIREASKSIVSKCYELPDEKRCDQFGIYVAEQIYSRKRLDDEINQLISKRKCGDHERLEYMLSLESSSDLKNIRNELIELSMPFKTDLIKLWEKDKNNSDDQCRYLADKIEDFETLFKYIRN